MVEDVPAGTVEASRVNVVGLNNTVAVTAAAADSPNNRTGTRRRVSCFSSHSSWAKCSSGRLSLGAAS
jgi:hypothetical protein